MLRWNIFSIDSAFQADKASCETVELQQLPEEERALYKAQLEEIGDLIEALKEYGQYGNLSDYLSRFEQALGELDIVDHWVQFNAMVNHLKISTQTARVSLLDDLRPQHLRPYVFYVDSSDGEVEYIPQEYSRSSSPWLLSDTDVSEPSEGDCSSSDEEDEDDDDMSYPYFGRKPDAPGR